MTTASEITKVQNGKYPSGNSLLVRGAGEAVIIDPSVDVVSMGGAPAPIDAVINSHSHEDHIPGNGLFTDARVHRGAPQRRGAVDLEPVRVEEVRPPPGLVVGLVMHGGAERLQAGQRLVEVVHDEPDVVEADALVLDGNVLRLPLEEGQVEVVVADVHRHPPGFDLRLPLEQDPAHRVDRALVADRPGPAPRAASSIHAAPWPHPAAP